MERPLSGMSRDAVIDGPRSGVPPASKMDETRLHVFGIRHHGPGSAHSLVAALKRTVPDCILLEGPPDADGLIGLVGQAEMVPPVAILVYAEDDPKRAVYFPFAEFSPEWQAIRYALENRIPIRFCDLPMRYLLEAERVASTRSDLEGEWPDEETTPAVAPTLRRDPLGALAAAAGYDDGERWWEHVIETAPGDGDAFPDVLAAMAELRAADTAPIDPQEARREAVSVA